MNAFVINLRVKQIVCHPDNLQKLKYNMNIEHLRTYLQSIDDTFLNDSYDLEYTVRQNLVTSRRFHQSIKPLISSELRRLQHALDLRNIVKTFNSF